MSRIYLQNFFDAEWVKHLLHRKKYKNLPRISQIREDFSELFWFQSFLLLIKGWFWCFYVLCILIFFGCFFGCLHDISIYGKFEDSQYFENISICYKRVWEIWIKKKYVMILFEEGLHFTNFWILIFFEFFNSLNFRGDFLVGKC